MDKAFWAAIIDRKGEVPEGHSAYDFVPELLAGLGSTDPELRDEMCLEILYHWIITGRLAGDELQAIAEQLMANLRIGIGGGENDDVFLRTFSAETLCPVLTYDSRVHVLAPEAAASVFAAGLRYMADEQDWRGYVVGKGWAHSVAHTADLLMAVAGHPQAGVHELQAILDAIAAKLQTTTAYFLEHNESFRLGAAVLAVLRRDLLNSESVVAWLSDIGGIERYKTLAVADLALRHNVTTFLAALHIMLTYQDVPEPVRSAALPAVRAALNSYLPRFV